LKSSRSIHSVCSADEGGRTLPQLPHIVSTVREEFLLVVVTVDEQSDGEGDRILEEGVDDNEREGQ